MLAHSYEFLFSYSAQLKNPPEVVGLVPNGFRVNFYIGGGSFAGPRMKGTILPVGGDWYTVRGDGVALVDVRGTLQTDDGAIISVAYTGVRDLGPEGFGLFLSQDLPEEGHVRIAGRLESADPRYEWVNRVQCVGVGVSSRARADIAYDVYAMR